MGILPLDTALMRTAKASWKSPGARAFSDGSLEIPSRGAAHFFWQPLSWHVLTASNPSITQPTRLSCSLPTVRNADQIVVIDGGRIVEQGNHWDLVRRQGVYFNLVRNQLDLEETSRYAS